MLSVILFHYRIPGFAGGFVGVDVFFVISGYLITNLIRADFERKSFSITGFYLRRARRIFPAMATTIAASLLVGFFVMVPEHFLQLATSALYAIPGLANFYFWQETGYWAADHAHQPLLHLWSLGVEEQFYLVWPFALLLMLRKSKNLECGLIVLVVLGSFSAAQAMLAMSPEAAFYLAPFRVGELALGSLVGRLAAPTGLSSPLAAIAGLAMIAWAVVTYGSDTPFPGLAAMVPCAGAALFIWAGAQHLPGRVLGSRIPAAMGRVSYSLYLVHWPVLVFFEYWKRSTASIVETTILLLLSLGLSAALYRWIEQPFRSRSAGTGRPLIQNRTVLLTVGIVGLSLAGLATVAVYNPAIVAAGQAALGASVISPSALSVRVRDFDESLCQQRQPGGTFCNHVALGGQRILLVGDSHAQHFRPFFKRWAHDAGFKLESWTQGSCYPVFGLRPYYTAYNQSEEEACSNVIEAWERHVLAERPEVVVLAAQWTALLEEGDYAGAPRATHYLIETAGDQANIEKTRELMRQGLLRTVRLIQSTGARAILVDQVPDIAANPKDCQAPIVGFAVQSACRYATTAEATARLKEARSVLADVANDSGAIVLDFQDALCDQEGCPAFVAGKLIYEDATHISTAGAEYLYELVGDELQF